MTPQAITALSSRLSPHIRLSKSRLETLSLLIVAMVSARTVNLSHLACERAGSVLIASTYRRLQRFFQHVSLPEDWSAGLVVRLLGLSGTWHLCLDRTNWKIGARDVNILMLAITTQRFRVPLMWTVLDKAGSSNAEERIALLRRYLALFGAGSVKLLLADREFIGLEWLNFLEARGIPFAIRVKAGMIVITEDGKRLRLRSLLAKRRPGRKFQATFPAQGDAEALTLTFAAKRIKGGELLIVASNVPDQNALNAYRRRWSIECLFGDAKTRGLNLEDTRMQTAEKLSLLLAIVAMAIAWANKTASALIGTGKLTRKTHGHYAKSWFRTGFDEVRRLLRSNPIAALDPWQSISKRKRVV
ncbi:transposase [Marivita cryptomonadis]|nr:transposase [Marivita cryptomonadis]